MYKLAAIIVAGGIGKRMGSTQPKQFLPLAGVPILMRTIQKFHDYQPDLNLIITLPHDHIPYWNQLVSEYDFKISHQVVKGGETRYGSVKNALEIVEEDSIVAIHDGVRPLVSEQMIDKSFQLAIQAGSAVACTPLKESIRELKDGVSVSVDRSKYRLIQTPQTFEANKIKHAYSITESEGFTDDASVYESVYGSVELYDGEYYNIKITTPEDMLFAESFVKGLP